MAYISLAWNFEVEWSKIWSLDGRITSKLKDVFVPCRKQKSMFKISIHLEYFRMDQLKLFC